MLVREGSRFDEGRKWPAGNAFRPVTDCKGRPFALAGWAAGIIELYGIAPNRVHTAYAGPNFDLRLINETLRQSKQSTAPTVLFIAKEFERKGGATVASAFARLRESMPAARLLFAGSETLPAVLSGLGNVEHLGLLDKADPAQLKRLLAAYRNADLLVLPSRRDPRKTEMQLQSTIPDAGVIHCNRFDPIYFGNLWHRQAHITPSGALVRRQALLDAGGFEESRSVMGVEDLNLWLKIALTDWRFVRSDANLFGYRPTEQSLSASDLKMARSELANIQMSGALVSCQPKEIERIKEAARIEYAKNLIAGQRWDEAAQLLKECNPGYASRWLSLARFLKINRLARTNLVKRLQSLDAQYATRECSGECSLSGARRKQCMDSCHLPYFRG